jgi:hypothetical protein
MLIDRLRERLRSEDGFSMIIVMIVLLVTLMLAGSAVTAAGTDMTYVRRDMDAKRALAAAHTGVAYFQGKLDADPNYFVNCAQPADHLFDRWNGLGVDPRTWQAVPSATVGAPAAQWTLEFYPPAGVTGTCAALGSNAMLDPATGNLTIRATGSSNAVQRSVLATFSRDGFSKWVYANDLEIMDPVLSQHEVPGIPASVVAWEATTAGCADYQRNGRDGRQPPSPNQGWWTCFTIPYPASDEINGPFHTNDSIATCAGASFGRPGKNDRIEFYLRVTPVAGCASTTPVYNTTDRPNPDTTGHTYPYVDFNVTNSQVKAAAAPAYTFQGKTTIVLNGGTMNVTGKDANNTVYANTPVPLPANGVVAVTRLASPSCATYDPNAPQTITSSCGTLQLQGHYNKDLTITTDDDVIFTNDVWKDNDSVLGIVANGFIRVARPMASYPCNGSTSDLTPIGTKTGNKDRWIEAAMVSISHVFTVDSYKCGAYDGYLRVRGAIAQRYRGRTCDNSVDCANGNGYSKDYQYDDRLRYRSSPYFVKPANAAWRALQQSQVSSP